MKTALNHYHWMKEKAEYFWIILHFCIFLLFFYYLRYVFSLFSRLAHSWSTVTGKRKDPGRRGDELLAYEDCTEPLSLMDEGEGWVFLDYFAFFYFSIIFLLLTICFQFVFQTSPSLEYCHWQEEGPRTTWRRTACIWRLHWTIITDGWRRRLSIFGLFCIFLFFYYFSITYDMFSVCFPD